MLPLEENLRGGTRKEVDGLPPCAHCGNQIGPGEGYRTVKGNDAVVESQHTIPLYFDEDALDLRDTLQQLGGFCIVETLPSGTPDVEWLPVAGNNEWTVITQDLSIMKRTEERQAVIDNHVKMFVLPEEPRNSWDTLRGFAAIWPKIESESIIDGPFVWKIHDDGHPFKWEHIFPPENIALGRIGLASSPIGHLLNVFADAVRWHDGGYFSFNYVDWIHSQVREEIEARIEGRPSPSPPQSEPFALLLDAEIGPTAGKWTSVDFEKPIHKNDLLAVTVDTTDPATGLIYPWTLPGRLMVRYSMQDGAEQNKEIGAVFPEPRVGFQRPHVGMLGTRGWIKRPMKQAGLR